LTSHPLINGIDANELLLAVISGFSDHKLSKEFMLDRMDVSTIRNDINMRYPALFNWIDQFKRKTIDQGFAWHENKRKYFDGLKSSNLEKRKIAINDSIKWIFEFGIY
jgi:DNA polymerase I-like protein with 3'-5' exonuclease and polymerase domains